MLQGVSDKNQAYQDSTQDGSRSPIHEQVERLQCLAKDISVNLQTLHSRLAPVLYWPPTPPMPANPIGNQAPLVEGSELLNSLREIGDVLFDNVRHVNNLRQHVQV